MISIVLGEYSGGSDSGRVAAAVVSGIGFLGAGAIIRHGHSVRGLTTAASIWVTAAVGVAAGIGWYEGAGLVTALTLIALLLLRKVEAMWSKERVHITIIAEHTPEEPDVIEALLKKHGAKSGRTRRTAIDEEGTLRITTQIQGVHQAARLVDDLEEHGFVESVTTQPELE
jgi:putative Mg2+ transporter-C (MgtC) family protein